jgi:HemY protein
MNRALIARPDPAWIADGFVSDRWLPMSPVSGRLDAFEWKVPFTEMEGPAPDAAGKPELPPVISEAQPASVAAEERQSALISEMNRPEPEKPEARPALEAARTKSTPRIVEPIVPLAHVPDDPGPEPDSEPEPIPETNDGGWRRRLLGG